MSRHFIIRCSHCGEQWCIDFDIDISAGEAVVNGGACPACENKNLAETIKQENDTESNGIST